MTKGFRKGMAVVLTAALALSTPVALNKTAVQAGTATTTADVVSDSSTTPDSVTGGAWWKNWSNYYKLTGDFDVTFNIKIDDTEITGNWGTPTMVFATDVDRDAAGYSEYLVIRSDQYGWGTSIDSLVRTNDWFTEDEDLKTKAVDGTGYKGTEEDPATWQHWRALMQGAGYEINVKRNGNDFTITRILTPKEGDDTYSETETFTAAADEAMRIFFASDANVGFTINSYTVNDYYHLRAAGSEGISLVYGNDAKNAAVISDALGTAATNVNSEKSDNYTWDYAVKSGGESVISVDTDGNVTAEGVGEDAVIVTVKDGSTVLDTIEIPVKVLTDISALESEYSIAGEGTKIQLSLTGVDSVDDTVTVAADNNLVVDKSDATNGNYTITPTADGTYTFTITPKEGYYLGDGAENTKTVSVKIATQGGEFVLDEALIDADTIKAAPNSGNIELSFDKTTVGADADVEVICKDSSDNVVPVSGENSPYSITPSGGAETYTFTITATLNGYKDDVQTKEVTITADGKLDAALIDEDETKAVIDGESIKLTVVGAEEGILTDDEFTVTYKLDSTDKGTVEVSENALVYTVTAAAGTYEFTITTKKENYAVKTATVTINVVADPDDPTNFVIDEDLFTTPAATAVVSSDSKKVDVAWTAVDGAVVTGTVAKKGESAAIDNITIDADNKSIDTSKLPSDGTYVVTLTAKKTGYLTKTT
jgi:hypothetical protein